MISNLITHNDLKQLLHYQFDTGIFTWIKSPRANVMAGSEAGFINTSGYRQIQINRKTYMASRLAWLYMYEQWPIKEIDHINRLALDNRIINLRLANRSENCHHTKIRKDNTSGYKGVLWAKNMNKWRVDISINKSRITLGYFKHKAYAALRYNLAATYFFGDFALLNQVEVV